MIMADPENLPLPSTATRREFLRRAGVVVAAAAAAPAVWAQTNAPAAAAQNWTIIDFER